MSNVESYRCSKDSNSEISLQADVMSGDVSPQRESWKVIYLNFRPSIVKLEIFIGVKPACFLFYFIEKL